MYKNIRHTDTGGVVQLVRIHACHAWGRGFEPRRSRQLKEHHAKRGAFFYLKRRYIMSDDNNPNWFIRLLKAMLFSPLNSLAILALLYFGFQAYVLGNSPWLNKMYMLGVVALWAFLFLAKNLLKLILILLLAAILFYGYYTYSRRDITACEESGGTWNSQTEQCEAPRTWLDKLKEIWQKSTSAD